MNTPWPLGEIPNHLQRPELKQLRELGYVWKYPHEVVDIFEKKITLDSAFAYNLLLQGPSKYHYRISHLMLRPASTNIKHKDNEGKLFFNNYPIQP